MEEKTSAEHAERASFFDLIKVTRTCDGNTSRGARAYDATPLVINLRECKAGLSHEADVTVTSALVASIASL